MDCELLSETNPFLPWLCSTYIFGGGLLIRLIMPNFAKLVARERELSADYTLVRPSLV